MKTSKLMFWAMLLPGGAFAVDGVVLINQSTVTSSGGFPFKITQPGSYRLSGNLTVPDTNTTAISITVDNVTLDLNGFSIIGPNVCTGTPVTSCTAGGLGNGVEGSKNNITVMNGFVKGIGFYGIKLSGTGSYVEKVNVLFAAIGIEITGHGTIAQCSASSTSGTGILAANATVRDSTAAYNGTDGIRVISGTVSSNTANDNGGNGISVACPSTVINNTANNNTAGNLNVSGSGCALANNAAP